MATVTAALSIEAEYNSVANETIFTMNGTEVLSSASDDFTVDTNQFSPASTPSDTGMVARGNNSGFLSNQIVPSA